MAKITSTSRIFGDLSELDEIPSESIEKYLVAYISMEIEAVGLGFTKPEEARANLMGVERFVSRFCGIHARLATQNRYYDFCNLSDEDMISICKKVCQE